MSDEQHEHWMRRALALASKAELEGEVPVGAVLVEQGEIIGEGFNQPISGHDPTAHGEIVALRAAAALKNNYRLPGTTLYVTLEPCTMCVGAILHARVETLVFGAREPRAGAVVSQEQLADKTFFNHRVAVIEGVLGEQCGEILSRFFAARRARS